MATTRVPADAGGHRTTATTASTATATTAGTTTTAGTATAAGAATAASTAADVLDKLRATEYGYLDEAGHVYLDYTGAGLAARSQLRAHTERISGGCYGNPHSGNPTSRASTELVERARAAVLRHFNAADDDYAVIFTPNATGACRLVGESYPFRRGGPVRAHRRQP